ncbi:hypothetical protein K2P97_08440 [bacterium]|nr:hypothetical protein [bacterium]
MNKFDDFFKSSSPAQLNKSILNNIESELRKNRQQQIRQNFITYFIPALTALTASFFAFKIFTSNSTDKNFISGSEAEEVLSDLIENTEAFEITEDLALIENLEELELAEEQDWEG